MDAIAIIQRPAPAWKGYVWPLLLSVIVLGIATIGGFIWRDGGFLTANILDLQGQSETGIDNFSTKYLPLGFAFTVGLVATLNPCGFIMLPAYLGLYIGTDDDAGAPENSGKWDKRLLQALITFLREMPLRMAKAGTVSISVGLGFIVLFGIVGLVITSVTTSIVQYFDWIGLGVGFLMGGTAVYVLAGGKLYNRFAQDTGAKIGDPRDTSLIGYFLFGISYAVASLGCTLPLFLSVVAASTTGSFLFGASQFVAYALGMTFIFAVLTLSVALFKGAIIKWMRKVMPYIQSASAVILLLSGAYLVFYWLTVGGLADAIAS
jgi:cytochrome c-type biogenesis protein